MADLTLKVTVTGDHHLITDSSSPLGNHNTGNLNLDRVRDNTPDIVDTDRVSSLNPRCTTQMGTSTIISIILIND